MQTTALTATTLTAKPSAGSSTGKVRRRTRLTYKDYVAITPADNGNYELINGNLVFMPFPTPQHQDLVAEVLSEGNLPKEMAFKKYLYETHGVREYWVVNLKKKTIVQYLNEEGEFQKSDTFNMSVALKSVVLEGFEVKLEDLM